MAENPPPSSLRLETATMSDRVAIAVRGDVDAHTAPQLHAVIKTTLEDCSVIELDMGELGFLDSSGLSVIAGAANDLAPLGGRLLIRQPTPSLLSLLEIADIARFVDIVDQFA